MTPISRAASTHLRDLVRAELDRASVTQTHIAETLGFSQKHISQVLTGRVGLSVDMAAAILRVVGRRLALSTTPLDGTR